MLYKIGELSFRLLGTNGFHVKAKDKRSTDVSLRCCQNLKYENLTSSFGRLRQNMAPKSVPHVQHDYFSSFNQSNHWFVALSLTLTLPSSNLKFPIIPGRGYQQREYCVVFLHCFKFLKRVILSNWPGRFNSKLTQHDGHPLFHRGAS